MMFRRAGTVKTAALVLATLLTGAAGIAHATTRSAVVPTSIIYPGEQISASRVEEVEVTNPNLAGGYAQTVNEVEGMVSKRTLLPGRTIQLSALREPFAVTRGANVRLTFQLGTLMISAAGSPLQDAAIGDVIRVRNLDSGVIVSGTVMQDGTIHVVAK